MYIIIYCTYHAFFENYNSIYVEPNSIDLPKSLQQKNVEVLIFPIKSQEQKEESGHTRVFGKGKGLIEIAEDFNNSTVDLFDFEK